ncbi:hypothetical protein N9O38_00940 [Flavobacteriaceae bacterium]|nr:hypothetical protein [Flavobacteriaceae bacterium]
MTISTTIIKNSYSGNASQTVFPYTFKISVDADIQVILRSASGTETVKAISTDYTVSGAGDANGGNVTMVVAPASGETLVIRRATVQTQTIDLVENDPFSAETVEGGFDKSISLVQEIQEQADRSIKLSRTNTMASTEFTVGATDRANKVLAFDGTGELSVAQELGQFQGNWTSGETYAQRDIIKDTSNGNIYICITAHTSSGAQPISTNTDSAKWSLLVDAESATTSATNAAASAAAALLSENNSATSESNASASEASALSHKNNAETAKTAAELAETNAETAETNAETAQTAAELAETNAETSETNAATSETNAATSETNSATSETNAATSEANAATSETNAATSETNAATSEANAATSETNASNSAIASANSATSAANSATAAETAYDNFDDRYLGPKASDPTLDNDGDALLDGALYFNTTSNVIKYYNGTSWSPVEAVDTSNLATNGFAIAMAIAL